MLVVEKIDLSTSIGGDPSRVQTLIFKNLAISFIWSIKIDREPGINEGQSFIAEIEFFRSDP
jgi:hypothetical protein